LIAIDQQRLNQRDAAPVVLQLCHGTEAPFHDIARQGVALFAQAGWQVVTIFLTGAANPEQAASIGGTQVIFLEYRSRDLHGLKRQVIRRVRELTERYQPVLCLAHRWKSVYIACHLPTIPVIGVHHALADYNSWRRRWFINRHQERLCLLAVSDATRDDIRRYLPRWPAERIQTLHNRLDLQQAEARMLDRAQARLQLQIPADAFVVGNVGRLHQDKDQATLLRAFAQALPTLPAKACLVITGKGELEASLRLLATQLGLAERVHFTGFVPNAGLHLRAFDLFVLSSSRESFGMVLLEAMAAGVPIVACDVGGVAEVLGESGQLVPAGSVEAMAAAMLQASQLDVEARQQLVKAMRSRLQCHFSDEAARNRFWQLARVRSLLQQ
jgi:glycosyltransferase involved in cell wall biosynthesis